MVLEEGEDDVEGEGGDEAGQMYRSLFDRMPEMVELLELVRDAEGRMVDCRYLEVNRAFATLAGRRREEIIGHEVLELELLEGHWRSLWELVGNTEAPPGEAFVTMMERSLRVHVMRLGRDRLAAMFEDVTELRRAREELRTSETHYRRLFDNLQEAVVLYQYVLDDAGEVVDWRYVDVNQAYEMAFRLPREAIIDRTVMQLLGPEGMAEYLPIVRSVRSERRPATNEAHYAPLSLDVLNLFAPVSDELFIVSSLDISDMVRFKARLERSNAELQHYAYVASHDLKEPLRMVTSYLSFLERKYAGGLDDRGREYLRSASDGAARMSEMIDDLLSYSKLEARESALAAVDMGGVLDTVLKDLSPAILESGASVTSDPLPTVLADRQQMVLLLENLVSNAIKYRRVAAPQVHVAARREEREWAFAVRDNGIGIASENKDRLFKMFSRLHTRDEYSGSGMGLAISKKIVERHGGRIWLESRPDEGTTFYFTIPCGRGDDPAAGRQPLAGS